jgi:putative membrane protein
MPTSFDLVVNTFLHGRPKGSSNHLCKIANIRGRKIMRVDREKHLLRGIVAGIAGGLVASLVMNEFMAGPGRKLQESMQSSSSRKSSHQQSRDAQQKQDDSDQEDATMRAADAAVNVVTGGRHLSHEAKEKGGPIVHYSFGALMGAIYGGLSEYLRVTTAGFGTVFGGALFAGADLIAVPALKLSGAPTEQPPSALATPFAAHLVYGVTTETVRRLMRPLL